MRAQILLIAAFGLTSCASPPSRPSAVEPEVRYASELMQMGMPDLAADVLSRLPDDHSIPTAIATLDGYITQQARTRREVEHYLSNTYPNKGKTYWVLNLMATEVLLDSRVPHRDRQIAQLLLVCTGEQNGDKGQQPDRAVTQESAPSAAP